MTDVQSIPPSAWPSPSGVRCTGRLAGAVNDTAVVEAAETAGLRLGSVNEIGRAGARGDGRAREILGGQAFTDFPAVIELLTRAAGADRLS